MNSKRDNIEVTLKKMLEAANLPVRASYTSAESCKILNISKRQFWRLIKRYECDESGNPLIPDSLDSILLKAHRRVTYPEFLSFLERNQGYEREHAIDQMQLTLW
ncbi:MAG: DNA-binding protein [Deltaproteobacteria bacterium]|nr:DNA-binding protein [Deltaproteobacteria bacterium]